MKTNVIIAGTEHILRRFDTRGEAEEWLTDNANEDGILTETEHSGRSVALVNVPTYCIETLHSYGQWDTEPEGKCNTIEEGEALIAHIKANIPEYADAEMRVVMDTAD
jgi:hypothetical protein